MVQVKAPRYTDASLPMPALPNANEGPDPTAKPDKKASRRKGPKSAAHAAPPPQPQQQQLASSHATSSLAAADAAAADDLGLGSLAPQPVGPKPGGGAAAELGRAGYPPTKPEPTEPKPSAAAKAKAAPALPKLDDAPRPPHADIFRQLCALHKHQARLQPPSGLAPTSPSPLPPLPAD